MPERVKHKGRFRQIPIYLGKLFRMFLYVNDWRVLPMSAIIAMLVARVAAKNMFLTMEGTVFGSLALSCICVWNGFFNSIQVVCRERAIVKREHRDGMHVFSYISAHVIYQAFLCMAQTVITVLVCRLAGLYFPEKGFVFDNFNIEIGITIFLTTFASDMMSLMISCIAKNTTSAMTIMPFVLIFELLFSDAMFELGEFAEMVTNLTITKWSINAFAAGANFNSLPMVTVWNAAQTLKGVEYEGAFPFKTVIDYLADGGYNNEITMWMGQNNQRPAFETSLGNIFTCWLSLCVFAALFIVLAVIFLHRVDKDKR